MPEGVPGVAEAPISSWGPPVVGACPCPASLRCRKPWCAHEALRGCLQRTARRAGRRVQPVRLRCAAEAVSDAEASKREVRAKGAGGRSVRFPHERWQAAKAQEA